jgi:hypothetical protein
VIGGAGAAAVADPKRMRLVRQRIKRPQTAKGGASNGEPWHAPSSNIAVHYHGAMKTPPHHPRRAASGWVTAPALAPARKRGCVLIAALLTACGGGGGSGLPAATPVTSSPTPQLPVAADINVLFMGNSHTILHDVPGTVGAMLRAALPTRTVATVRQLDSLLLNERGDHEPSLAMLRSQRWHFVVLQAQDYSSSGLFVYPTTGAEKLVRLARAQGAVPILFAEWPRRGLAETPRIVATYAAVAAKEPACLPPIPQSFDKALARHPQLQLHAEDGNHAAPAGAYLAALSLFATIANKSPAELPTLALAAVDAATQQSLREVAQETLREEPAKRLCPND